MTLIVTRPYAHHILKSLIDLKPEDILGLYAFDHIIALSIAVLANEQESSPIRIRVDDDIQAVYTPHYPELWPISTHFKVCGPTVARWSGYQGRHDLDGYVFTIPLSSPVCDAQPIIVERLIQDLLAPRIRPA